MASEGLRAMVWDILLVVATALEMGRETVATSLARSMSGQRCKMETRKNMSFYLVTDPLVVIAGALHLIFISIFIVRHLLYSPLPSAHHPQMPY